MYCNMQQHLSYKSAGAPAATNLKRPKLKKKHFWGNIPANLTNQEQCDRLMCTWNELNGSLETSV